MWQWGEEETEPKDASASVTIQCPARERALGYMGAEDGVGTVKAKGEDLGLLLDTTLCFPPRPCMSQASVSEKEEINGS